MGKKSINTLQLITIFLSCSLGLLSYPANAALNSVAFFYGDKPPFKQIPGGGSLGEIYSTHNNLVSVSRSIIYDIVKIQGFIMVIFYFLGPSVLQYFHIEPLYIYILNILIFAISLNILLWAIIDILYYFI